MVITVTMIKLQLLIYFGQQESLLIQQVFTYYGTISYLIVVTFLLR